MKKMLSLLLAIVMLFSMTLAVAEEEEELAAGQDQAVMLLADAPTGYTVTVENAMPNHVYTAYQIFDGDLVVNEDGSTILSNIVWGDGVDAAELLAKLKADPLYAACKTAADVAAVLADTGSGVDTVAAKAFADIVGAHVTRGDASIKNDQNYTITELDPGYYLIVDSFVGEDGTENVVLSRYIMEVVDDVKVTPKADYPEVEKTVNDPDVNIGDTVTFTLTATMPNTILDYDAYKVYFHDTMSAGLTFVEGSVKVMIGETDVTEFFAVAAAVAEDGVTKLDITCEDVTAEAIGATNGSVITVTYEAVVNEAAVIGAEGNPNKVYLEYSNNPNPGGEGETGKTPEEEVKVYTWELPVFKYTQADANADKVPLAGAGFTLTKDGAAVNLVATDDPTIYKVCTKAECTDHAHVTEIVTGETGKFEIEGLEQGTYVLKETTTPAGYNTCLDITVVIGENGVLSIDSVEIAQVEVLNQAGTTLPSTGGMGTTMFYTGGGILLLAAFVLLVARRRASTEK